MAEMNRLTRLRPGNLGHLGFLPLEVCNKIYAFLLAEFYEPCNNEFVPGEDFDIDNYQGSFACIPHSVDTAILRASRDTHREAYDLMVKENRFVHLKSQGVPHFLLTTGAMPIVTKDTDRVSHFKGYVLEVNMSYHGEPLPPRGETGALEAMILAAHLGFLCERLMVGNTVLRFSSGLTLRLDVGPVVAASREAWDYKDPESLQCYFTEKTQQELLKPLRDNLYAVRDVQVCGLVSTDVVSSTLNAVASSRWGCPQDVLEYVTARKETGMQLYRRNKHHLAGKLWMQIILEIDMLHNGGDWSELMEEAGEHCTYQLAEMYFRLCLNCVHIDLSNATRNPSFLKIVESLLFCAGNAMRTGQWKEGLTWRPSKELEAKFHLRKARFLRLRGDLLDVIDAMDGIDRALQLCPDDPVILGEQLLVVEWAFEANTTAH